MFWLQTQTGSYEMVSKNTRSKKLKVRTWVPCVCLQCGVKFTPHCRDVIDLPYQYVFGNPAVLTSLRPELLQSKTILPQVMHVFVPQKTAIHSSTKIIPNSCYQVTRDASKSCSPAENQMLYQTSIIMKSKQISSFKLKLKMAPWVK